MWLFLSSTVGAEVTALTLEAVAFSTALFFCPDLRLACCGGVEVFPKKIRSDRRRVNLLVVGVSIAERVGILR